MAKDKKEDSVGLFIPAGLFLGLGVGSLYGNYAAGALVGFGLGFLAMAIVRIWKR